jgi:formylglycine-generating enzyme required for sulfatase activity
MIDTLVFTLSGYITVQVPVTSYTGQNDAVLQPAGQAPGGMRLLSAGTFRMGADVCGGPTGGPDGTNACPSRMVTLSAFYVDTTEVTQKDYVALMGGNPSSFTGDLNRPVESVTWWDAVLYCNARSKRDGRDTVYAYTGVTGTPVNGYTDLANLTTSYTKKGYRLPTQAEWEYACRAGSNTGYYWGDSIDGNYCWYPGNANDSTHEVAKKKPNAWGLYDMSGNVFEWTGTWVTIYTADPLVDPTGNPIGNAKLSCGGAYKAWNNNLLRSRYNDDYNYHDIHGACGPDCGFRVVRPY